MLSLSIALEGGQTTSFRQRRERIQALLLDWYGTNRRDLPWRRSRDPYPILVSEVMLQQTQVHRVTRKYAEFLDRFPDLTSLAQASTADVIRVWAPLGYNRRAVNLQRLAREVLEKHGGLLPDDLKALRALPGVGAYTAAAVACFAFGRAEATVDTNVRRVLGRLEGAVSLQNAEVARLAAAYLPDGRTADWNQALMDLGAAICRAASPECPVCPVRTICRSAGVALRERPAPYRLGRQERFEGSDRYLRGRVVEALRHVESLSLAEIAASLGLSDEPGSLRLGSIVSALERDSLVVAAGGTSVRLPD